MELRTEQRRQLIDAQQAYRAWRDTKTDFEHGYPDRRDGYRAEMRWKKVDGKEYLYRGNRSLGPRSPATEAIKAEYSEHRALLRARLTRQAKRLEEMRRVNRAMGLGRVPKIVAQVLRKLDATGLLGSHLFVAGTHAMFAYEARSGILFGGDLTATTDVDLLWDARIRFSFLMRDINERGVLGLLRQVDGTFRKTRSYRAENDDPYLVEIIRPERPDEAFRENPRVTAAEDDLEPAAIEGLHWLVNSPKFEEVAIAEDGLPVMFSCVDPRVFALHKLWLSRRPTREGIKRARDLAQAVAVASIVPLLGLQFDRRALAGIPKLLSDGLPELVQLAQSR